MRQLSKTMKFLKKDEDKKRNSQVFLENLKFFKGAKTLQQVKHAHLKNVKDGNSFEWGSISYESSGAESDSSSSGSSSGSGSINNCSSSSENYDKVSNENQIP